MRVSLEQGDPDYHHAPAVTDFEHGRRRPDPRSEGRSPKAGQQLEKRYQGKPASLRRVRHRPQAIADERARHGPLPRLQDPGHADRAPPVQPDVQDERRGPRGRVERRLPAARDGAGDLRQLQERARHQPREAAVRHRPDRQELPQRDHAAELHLPLARVRADGDRVLLPSRGGGRLVRLLAEGAVRLVRPPRLAERPAPAPRPRPGRAGLLLDGDRRHRVRVPLRRQRAGGDRPPGRLRPEAAPEAQRQGPDLLRRGVEGAVPAARHRALGRGRPRDAGLPLRGVHRGRGRRRVADGPEVPPAVRADQGGRLPAGQEGRHARDGRGDLSTT